MIKTLDFLPIVFQTPANQKFLNATLDQLVTQPNLKKVNGYIGRKFAPTFKVTDNYISEPTAERQNYQLEPSVVSLDSNGKTQFFSTYTDLLQQIKYYGGFTNNHSRLFSQESYTFDGQFDFDKFVNFSEYYWVPNGPEAPVTLDSVAVIPSAIDFYKTFNVARNVPLNSYTVAQLDSTPNPEIIIARGGTYQFVVNQPGFNFWIQTEPGTSGINSVQPNINTRTVLGVTNNGTDVGTITFTVPQADAQDGFITMPIVQAVDYAVTQTFIDIDNQVVQNIAAIGGLDGVSTNLNGKYIIFIANDTNDADWSINGMYGVSGYDQDPYNMDPYDQYGSGVSSIPEEQRTGVWQINVINVNGVDVVKLHWVQAIPQGQKVFIKAGNTYANYEFYKTATNLIDPVPLMSASLDTLYYQDSSNSNFYGKLRIVDSLSYNIDVTAEILGQQNYVSPNGIIFTNGLKVTFNSNVTPATYANKTYYVQGVGTSIQLLDWETFITPELSGGPQIPDYLTIDRSSIDRNAWSRSNRWFHADVIAATAAYNNTVPMYDQLQRASRPIIEFSPNLQLFNNGRIAHTNVTAIDFIVKNAFTEIQNATYPGSFNTAIYAAGNNIIFAGDTDPLINTKVYTVDIVTENAVTFINLVEVIGGDAQPYDVIIPTVGAVTTSGLISGVSYWFSGTVWSAAQQKTGANQAPLFDIIDSNFNSFADISVYNASSFNGCKIFSYYVGTGTVDSVLGFPISYRNIDNVGDIEFTNNYDTDIFNQLVGIKTIVNNINSGFIARIADRNTVTQTNVWVPRYEKSKQYQVISYTYNGSSTSFVIDILPDESVFIPNLKVFINSKEITPNYFSITSSGAINYVTVTLPLTFNDEVDILIYSSTQVSSLGYYEIPTNLDYNALNQNFSVLTHGQFRNHLSVISSNTTEISGTVPGNSNLRDLNVKSFGGSILQHSSPVIYSELFLLNNELNFIDASTYAQQEYSRFKNRFLETFTSIVNAGISDPVIGTDAILSQITAVKNNQSPWYYSDMVPYSSNKNTITYTVLNLTITKYEIPNIFNDTVLSNRAILVYLNGTQLLREKDYMFDQGLPAINFTTALNYNDVITINVYSNTDGNFIPETPTKLGLWPKFTPEKFLDTSYQTPVWVIRGHDGSITPAFNDLRDDLLLELETRIYNNIKVSYDITKFDIYNYVPGKFRTTEYNKVEFDQILSRSFMTWISNNRTNYSDNQWFQNGNPFSWTYSSFKDRIDGSYLPGYWKGIFNYFYDTEAPHLRPWEMLGFSEEPNWWILEYGPSPYTGGNKVLWDDLESGTIRQGPHAGTHLQYARPGLSTVIPVDSSGTLLSPNEAIVASFNGADVDGTFVFGDEGPVETAWRNSSDYPFAVQRALAIMKPALYFGQLANVGDYSNINELNQWLFTDTNQHLTLPAFEVNGEIITAQTASVWNPVGSILRQAGYLNWISDYVIGYGANGPAQIHKYLNNLQVNLGYRCAGFTDQPYMSIYADQVSPSSTGTNKSVVIPNENYQVYVHKSAPVANLIYSGVIIEKTSMGFSVSGYSTEQPYFTVIPSNANSNSYTILAAGATGIIYNSYQSITTTIPYGHEFVNKQQVVDFLTSYGRYLISQGFAFNDIDPDLQVAKDWVLAAKEFLTWTQQGWAVGNIIVVSPISNSININTANGVVDAITNLPAGSKVMDVGFNIIKSNYFTVTRDNGTFTLTTSAPNISIGLLDVSIVQYENALIFDNETVFGDIIYAPSLGNRQFRLKLIGSITQNWTGEFNPPGFIYNSPDISAWQQGQDYRQGDIVSYSSLMYTALQDVDASATFNYAYWSQVDSAAFKTGMLPNLSTNASKFLDMYNVDNQVGEQDINEYAMGLIGYRDRDYLTQLRVDTTSQVKFYQGFVKQKGTIDSISALSSATFDNLSGKLNFYEEWAFRVGSYGATLSNQFVEVQLSDSEYTYNPISFSLLNNGEKVNDVGVVGVYNSDLYKKPLTYTPNIIATRSSDSIYANDITSAGYPNLNDVDATVFDITDTAALNALVPSLYTGFTLWVAKDSTQDWNVYRLAENDTTVIDVLYQLNGYAQFTMSDKHNLSVNDIFAVKGFSQTVDGFYTVIRKDDYTVFVATSSVLNSSLLVTPEITGNGLLFKLRSSRINTQTDIISITPAIGWNDGDTVWINDNTVTSNWGVYQKGSPWGYVGELSANSLQVTPNSNTGISTASSLDGLVVLSGAPNYLDGAVKTFVKQGGSYVSSASILPNDSINKPTLNLQANIAATLPFIANLTFTPNPNNIITVSYDIGAGLPLETSLYTVFYSNSIVHIGNISNPLSSNIKISEFVPEKFGTSVEIQQSVIAVGAPSYQGNLGINTGRVAVYDIVAGNPTLTQLIDPDLFNEVYGTVNGYQPILSGDKFGSSISISGDSRWLYVGAPGHNANVGAVYALRLNSNVESFTQTLFTPGSISSPGSKGPYPLATNIAADILGITVSSTYYTFAPNVDYFISANTITFAANTIGLTYTITQRPYYDFCNMVVATAGATGDRFGSSLKTQNDGTYLLVGAPEATSNIGQAYIFNRSVQEFVADGSTLSYQLYQTPNQNTATYYLDTIEFSVVANPNVSLTSGNLVFASNLLVPVNTVIRAELNNFTQIQAANNSTLGLTANAIFGYAMTLASGNDEIFIGAPAFNGNIGQDGLVYRFTNTAVSYNTALINTASLTSTANIIINNQVIHLASANIANVNSIVNTVNSLHSGNSAGIVGLTASNESGNLRITYNSSVVGDVLNVLVTDNANSLYSPYTLTQTIQHPISYKYQYPYFNSEFGSALAYEENSGTLVVTGLEAPLVKTLIFIDNTTFDLTTTTFFEVVGSGTNEPGSTYVFEELNNPLNSLNYPSQFSFTQVIQPSNLSINSGYGTSVALSYNAIFIGADQITTVDQHGVQQVNAGGVYAYSNPGQLESWQLIRSETPKVDLDNVTRAYLYDSKTESMLALLDFIDPSKGKILGIADQDIKYKSSVDPARYNTGTNSDVSISANYCWGNQQVGQVWWNLDKVRYIDYEQDSLTYRIKHWGELFPGSEIEINEWVESSVLPSQYKGDGTVKYSDNSAYVQKTMVSPVTGFVINTYYFWVSNRTQLDSTLTWRTSTSSTIANLIKLPSTQNIPYAQFIQDNSVSLVSSTQFINSDTTILHLDYNVVPNSSIIHNEYALVQENSPTAALPTAIVKKMIDSLTGADQFGNPVPDPALGIAERYGITIRPRQTMFVYPTVAAENLVKFCNTIFLTVPIVDEFDLSKLYLAEPAPTTWDSKNVSVATPTELTYLDPNLLTAGQVILVNQDPAYNNGWAEYTVQANKTFVANRTQTYQTTNYWSKIDWFDLTYDSTVRPTYTIATLADMSQLTLAIGNIVWVKNDGTGLFVVYRVNADLSTSMVGHQQGTIQFSDALWNHAAYEIGFDNDRFDTVKFDLNPTTEFRNIIDALYNDIFIGNLQGKFNDMFFMLLNYILSEQRMVDWAFKTSFVSVIQELRKLEQFPNYVEDNQTYYEDYINEVKPYRTTIREYVIDYKGTDAANVHPADFDLPAYYDTEFNIWRSPSGEHAKDALLLSTLPQYADWYSNQTYNIGNVEIARAGFGYSVAPQLTVIPAIGDTGTGAVLTANIDPITGSITSVIVVKPGVNYKMTPTILVQGNGVDEYGNQTAQLYPLLVNNTVRSFDTTLKFDRISYTSNVKQWSANTIFYVGDTISYNNLAYTPNTSMYSSNVSVSFNSNSVFDTSSYTLIPEDQITNAADRVMAFYAPTAGMPPKNLGALFSGTEYPGNQIDGTDFTHTTINGIEYTVDSSGNMFMLDSNIQSEFADVLLGTRPEDINIDGGNFVDTYNSHAPEELVPGIIYDTLDMKVFTIDSTNPTNAPVGYRMTKSMLKESVTVFDTVVDLNWAVDSTNIVTATTTFNGGSTTFDFSGTKSAWEFKRICAAATTTLAKDLWITDTTISVVDATGLFVPNPSAGIPGVIYINSEKIIYWEIDQVNGILGHIRRGAWGTGSPVVVNSIVQPWVANITYNHGEVVIASNMAYIANGSVSGTTVPSLDPRYVSWGNSVILPSQGLVVDASLDQTIPGNTFQNSWLDMYVAPTQIHILEGNGLRAASTVEATFLKDCPSYIPFLPGASGIPVDPNMYHTRFDDDGTEGGSGTVHPFDIDPWDSWTVG